MRQEADREGISANQWIAETILSRIVLEQVRRGDPVTVDWERVQEMVRELREEAGP